jgi:dihydroorotate dehydrogenase (fumarate)
MSANLKTKYLEFELRNPLIASAGPLTGRLESLLELQSAGIGAVVLPSLFEEQIRLDQQRVHALGEFQTFTSAESLSYFPKSKEYRSNPREYLELVERASDNLEVPVIASLNGMTSGGWARYAKLMEEHGADAVELNIYYVATDPNLTATDIEKRYVDLVSTVRAAVKIPIAVKLGQQFTNLTNFVPQLIGAGASGIVLFNRFLEPDIDLEFLRVDPQLVLSSHHESRAALRWIAILRDQVATSLGATGGVHFPTDVIKLLLVGADACLVTSTLLRHGIEYVKEMLRALQVWLDEHEYESVEQLKGSMSYRNSPDSGNFERANYMKAIVAYTATC